MELKLIKTETQYRAYLAEVERLAAADPLPGTPEGDRLELLAKLVEDYEKECFPFKRPDPVSAIRFRMEEQGLRQTDLAPILGGKNRVSEVLSYKRPLTLQMVRALSDSLRIPAELLIREPDAPRCHARVADEELAVPLLIASGLLPQSASRLPSRAIAKRYLEPTHGPLYVRRTVTFGAAPDTNKTLLRFWVSRVRELAAESRRQRAAWRPGTLNGAFLSYVAKLSGWEKGPQRAQEFLAEKGIALIILPALPMSPLDGAAMLDQEGAPVIGMTIRLNRLDSFWFTLLHELVHVWKHLRETDVAIVDENMDKARDDDVKEIEANRLAWEAFVPAAHWKRHEAFQRPSAQTIDTLANELHISPAVIAGRLRREKPGCGAFARLVGRGAVRRLFTEVRWR